MLKQLKKNNKGFTIIEVMIVLAIAGLIILVVLLAIPALQRNGRNTAMKSDASAIAGGIGEFASNNDGAIPTAAQSSCTTGSVTLSATGKTDSTPKVQGATKVTCVSSGSAVTPNPGEITVVFGYKCPATVSGTSVTPVVSARSTAIIYANETNGANQAKCLDS